MATLATLVSTLRDNASITVAEYDDDKLIEWVKAALAQHNRSYTSATLPAHEADAVVLLAWIKACFSRAGKASMYYSISGERGSTNKAEIVTNCITLARELREEYIKYCERIGISPCAEIAVSDLEKMDSRVDMETPLSSHLPPDTCALSVSNYTGSTVDLSWSEAMPKDTFVRYRLFYGTQPGLKDMTTVGDELALYNGVNLTKATLLKTYEDKWRTACRIQDLDPSLLYYFVLVLEDTNGRFSVSNEVGAGGSVMSEMSPTLRTTTFLLTGALVPEKDYVLGIAFSGRIKIMSVIVQVDVAPAIDPLIIEIRDAAGGDGNVFSVSLPAGVTAVSVSDQVLHVGPDTTLYVRVGATTGSVSDAEVTIGYLTGEDNFEWYTDARGAKCLRIKNDDDQTLEDMKPAGA